MGHPYRERHTQAATTTSKDVTKKPAATPKAKGKRSSK